MSGDDEKKKLDVLRGVDVTPEMLRSNMRANLFPHLTSSIQRELKATLLQSAVHRVARLESYQAGDKDMKIKKVEPVEVQNPRMWRLLNPKSEIMHAEKWTVGRGEVTRDYRIHYLRHYSGDGFYVGVLPLSLGGAFAWTRAKATSFLFD
mmetsp:Transcript_9710/g.15593  ORF Transcript_9710/g.15593 Transcript_9710/m.15593 type:complete len:150 (+) Transcript_9710:100-549(+)